MPLIFHNYDPLECSCSSISSELYCAYCNIVCDHALFDFEADIGQWVFFGQSDFSVSEEARCWVALDQLYREERPITLPQSHHVPLLQIRFRLFWMVLPR
ncbi:hypothetical protein RhiJN_11727 [Ceratobasidium sp. AG-Ba]|nr:hypothetical protein RhiJN_11727 [Ceratobasidium sp. AG-Ba]